MTQRTSVISSFSDSSLYLAIFSWSSPPCMAASVAIRFIAVIPHTARRTAHRDRVNGPIQWQIARVRHLQRVLASKRFWMCGSRSVGPPVGLSGSGTKWGFSSASHGCANTDAAFGRFVGSTVRQSLTKFFAVSDTFAQYSSVRSVSGRAQGRVGRTCLARICNRQL
jgi:hypothetical protein